MHNKPAHLFYCIFAVTIAAHAAVAGLIGGNIQVSGGGCRFPDVAYGSVNATYLVVWTDYNVAKVFGRFVTNAGAVSGNIFGISEFGALFPAVAYNATNNEFLVTWDDQRGPIFPIWGQRVRGSDGALLGANFQIGASEGIRSAVAWSSTSNVYAVTYWTNSSETYVQRVGGTGGLVGGEINVSQDAAFSGYPAIAYGATGNQFLVSWDSDTGNIYARRVDAGSGALLGGVVVMTAGGTNDRSCIAYDSVNSRWAVAYNKQITGLSYNQWARNINTSGTLVGAEYPIANTVGFEGDTNFGGDIAFVPGLAQYFSSFGTDTGWGGQPVDANGNSIGSQVVLGTGADTSGNNAADTALNRFLPVWEGSVASVYYVWGQLYQADPAPPGPVTNFVASSSSGQNVLTWTNPTDPTFTGTLIRFRTDTYPISRTDGTLVIDKANTPGTNDSHTHSGLTNGTTYYYSAWAHDSTPLYSNVRNANGTPTPPACFSDSFAYANGNLNGNGGWSGTAGAEIQIVSQTVKINGGATAFDSIKTVTCGDPGVGFIRVTVKVQIGTGSTTMWSLWYDDAAGANLARWYGTGTTAKGRIGNTTSVTADQFLTGGWDELMVKINPYNNTSEFFFNGGSIGVLDHSVTGAADTLGRLRFERLNNSGAAGNFLSFDDLSVGEPSGPPGQASNPSPANGATGVSITPTLSWSAGANATSRDVNFGSSNPPPFIQNQTATSYSPGTLASGTIYYWRIDEKNSSGTTTGIVWSFTTTSTPPAAPTISSPTNGSTVTTLTPTITWTGDPHDQYEVHISQQNDSATTTNGWGSGIVTSTGNSAVSGTLRNYSFCYVFVRLHNAAGWSSWSAGGYNFIVNTDSTSGTVYLANSLPTANSWTVFDTSSFENGSGITSTITADGGSNVWKLADNSNSNRCKEHYTVTNISFDTGASVASRMRCSSTTGSIAYNLGISNGNVGGMFLRLSTTQVVLVDTAGTSRGSFSLGATTYHKYQLTVKNGTVGNNATAVWRVYVDGTQRITWTGAGTQDGSDGFFAGHAGTNSKGTWWFDSISGRADGEFSPAQWDPVY